MAKAKDVPEPSSVPLPRLNDYLIGHEAAEQDVLSAHISGRFHHAWLIIGKRGIGKATLAYRIARYLLAHGDTPPSGLFGGPETLDIGRDHPVFHRVAQGSHGDLRVVQREWDEKKKRFRGEIVIDSVRGVGSFLSMTAGEGGWRIVLVDAADDMNEKAANALLKVLEEPPKRAVLLLLAHNPARLLPTIRSRCRRLTLSPLSDDQVEHLMQRYRPDLDLEDSRALARLGEGSIGRALDLADQGGLQLYQGLVGLLKGLPRLDVPALHAFAEKAVRGDDGFRVTSELLLWWLGRTIAAGGRGTPPVEVVPGENGLMRALLAAAPLDRWVEVWENLSRLVERAEAVNLDKKQVVISAIGTIDRLVQPHR